jgi:hypothetical protein
VGAAGELCNPCKIGLVRGGAAAEEERGVTEETRWTEEDERAGGDGGSRVVEELTKTEDLACDSAEEIVASLFGKDAEELLGSPICDVLFGLDLGG